MSFGVQGGLGYAVVEFWSMGFLVLLINSVQDLLKTSDLVPNVQFLR